MDSGEITIRANLETLRDHVYLAFQVWCEMVAAREASTQWVAGQRISLEVGQFAFSRPAVAEALGTSEWQIRRCLTLALDDGVLLHAFRRQNVTILELTTRRQQIRQQKTPQTMNHSIELQAEGSEIPPASPPANLEAGKLKGTRQQIRQQKEEEIPSVDAELGRSTRQIPPANPPASPGEGGPSGPVRHQNRQQEEVEISSTDAELPRESEENPPANPPAKFGQEGEVDFEVRTSLLKPKSKSKSKPKPLPPEARTAAELLARLVLENNPANTQLRDVVRDQNIARWAADLERLNRIDGASWPQIEWMIRWTQRDSFWRSNILSGAKLREKWNQLVARAVPKKPGAEGGHGKKGKASITELVQAQLERLDQAEQQGGNDEPQGGNGLGRPHLLALPLGES